MRHGHPCARTVGGPGRRGLAPAPAAGPPHRRAGGGPGGVARSGPACAAGRTDAVVVRGLACAAGLYQCAARVRAPNVAAARRPDPPPALRDA